MWKLFGGKYHERLRVYANGWYQGPRDPAFFAEKAASITEQGYTAFKFDPFGGAYQQINKETKSWPSRSWAVRKQLVPKVDILIECHDRFTVGTAVRLGRRLEAFSPMWMETPVALTTWPATWKWQEPSMYRSSWVKVSTSCASLLTCSLLE